MKVQGFSAAAVKANIRYPDRLDLGLIVSEVPAVTAGVFTTNQVKAAPLLLDMERLKGGRAQAVLVNSGNANACTGRQGLELARRTSALVAEALGIDEELVQTASTGVIGEDLALEPFEKAVPILVEKLAEDGFTDLARAIMTTDTMAKLASKTITVDKREIRLLGVAKGSGMIMPNMATMLCFVVTDAAIDQSALHKALTAGVDHSFNRITVDGDTSTNDMVLVMANGAAGNREIDQNSGAGYADFCHALEEILRDLARKIVEDGEGATKMVTVRVTGAPSEKDALSAARTIANSALVKTAFFGEDANWGRIIAALGRSDCPVIEERVAISFDEVCMVRDGLGLGSSVEAAATEVLRRPVFTVSVDLGSGNGEAEVLTCDFSYDYVKINADYRT